MILKESSLPPGPTDWKTGKLSDIADVDSGFAFPSKDFSTEGIAVLRQSNLTEDGIDLSKAVRVSDTYLKTKPKFVLQTNDILIGMSGSIGEPCTFDIDETVLLNQRVGRIRPREGVSDARFIKHQLSYLTHELIEKSRGQGVLNLSTKDLANLEVDYPDLPKQELVANSIDQLFEIRNAARDRLATIPALLKKFRQSVLAAACSGQLTADWRESEGSLTSIDIFLDDLQKARRLSGAKTPKNAQAEPTPVFDIPDSWRWVSLRTLVDLKGGVTKGEKRKAGQALVSVPYLRVANVQRGFLDLKEVKYIEATNKDLEELRLQPNDILFNEGGDRDKLGRGWVWEGQIPGCIHQNHVFRGRLFDQRIPAKLVSLYGNSIGAQHFIDEGKQTVNLASLSITKLGDMAFPLAPPEEMQEIMRRVESLFALADSIESRLAEATDQVERTTQAILAKAFRGELTGESNVL